MITAVAAHVGSILKNARFAPLDSLPTNQKDCNQINAITVRALGCGSANAVGGVDAKLVRLGVPGLRSLHA